MIVMTPTDGITCEETKIEHNTFDNIYRSPLDFTAKNKLKIAFVGGSTLVDNWGLYPVHETAQAILDKFEVINLSSYGFSLGDHLYNLNAIQTSFNRGFVNQPFLKNNEYKIPASIKRLDYGLKDLKPDFIVLAPAWNTLIDEYFINLFNSNKSITLDDNNIPLITNAISNINNFERLKKIQNSSKNKADLKTGLRKHYSILLNEYIKRAKTNIVLVNMPSSVMIKDKKFQDYITSKATPFLSNGLTIEYLRKVAGIQTKVLNEVSSKYKNVTLLDLSKDYIDFMSPLSLRDKIKKNIILDDLIHFRANGSVWVAGKISEEIKKLTKKKGL